ncbi:MAG TPA: beta-L-arabinofuranosidase domain-containing protein [Roseiflexaceae bacterium]|nr:beta-L-arabinofuranosidase domain-containing protein [Roseiflexaceae bacterium]
MTATLHPAAPLPNALAPLPLGAVRPAGWLLAQLHIQAAGLSGHLAEHWPDVAQSAWIGGAAEGWERGPYWLDGAVPLAFLLDDERLKATVARWVDAILARQRPDGWLGPVLDTSDTRRRAYDPWPVFVALKALAQYQEATGDARIIPAMLRFLRRLDTLLDEQPLFDWGRYRWADLAVSILWLYERAEQIGPGGLSAQHAARSTRDWLRSLAEKSYRQSFDWRAHFERFPYTEKQRREQIHPPAPPEPLVTFRTDLASHVVNNAMAIKQPGLRYRFSRDPADRAAVHRILDTLDAYHGQVTGLFTGDEHLAGLSPSQGTELCAVVEYMYSLEVLLAALGEPRLADRLERIAYNALPATFTPDMWGHQYVQQANQVLCAVVQDRVYTNNGPDANLFGLEPNYGCCTANMHQGWPKLAAHLWMRAPDGGLAAVIYAPCTVRTEAGGATVAIAVATDYPFDEELRITVEVDRPARFPLHLRVPTWTAGATLAVGDGPPQEAVPGTFHPVEREWHGAVTLSLRLPMRARALQRPHGGVAIERGPLIYALPVGEEWRAVRSWGWPELSTQHSEPSIRYYGFDWEVHPTTPWNYALELDPVRPEEALSFTYRPLGETPFTVEGAPVVAHVRGRRVPTWGIEHGAAAPPPPSPVATEEPLEELTLVPYGCARLRISEFPITA